MCIILSLVEKRHVFEQAVMQHPEGRGQCSNIIYMKEANPRREDLGTFRVPLETIGEILLL